MYTKLLRTGISGLFLCITLIHTGTARAESIAAPQQAPCDPFFDVDTLIIGDSGSGYTLSPLAGVGPYTAATDAGWLSLSQTGVSLEVTAAQSNDLPSQRTGHITITHSGTCTNTESITVIQSGKTCVKGIDGTPGRKFWAAFLENRYLHSYAPLTTDLVFATFTAATGTISNPNTGWSTTFTVPAKGIATVHVPHEQAYSTVGETVDSKAVYVESSTNVSIYALNFQETTSDAAVVLPVEALGDEYYSMSFNGNEGQPNSGDDDKAPEEFLIVATENNTLVTIVPTSKTGGDKPAGKPYTIRLQKGQTYLVKSNVTGSTDSESNYASITGSYIKSNELIAVFAGNKRAHVGCKGFNNRDHLYEQLLPLRLWGTKYLVVPTELNEDLYRILAIHDGTKIAINTSGAVTQVVLNKGEHRDFSIKKDQTAFIDADQPVSVALFAKSMNCTRLTVGDPFMIILNPVQNMTKELTFSPLPSKYITEHYINITVKTQDKQLTQLVNEQTGAEIPISFTDIANLGYSYAKIRVNVATHSLKNEMGFTAYAYGAGNADSYGYLVGARFNHLPEPTIVRDTIYCVGEKPQPLSVYDGNDLLWYTSDDSEHETSSPTAPTFNTNKADTLIYYVSQLIECSESPRKKVTIIIENPPSDPVVSTSHSESSANFCRGESEVLQAEATHAGSFEWYKDNKFLPGVSSSSITVTDAGIYYVRAKSEHSCYAANSSNLFKVTVHDLPAAPTLSNADICRDDIPAAPEAPNGYTFLWYDSDNKPLTGAPLLQSSATTASTYYIVQKDNATGCEGPAATWVYTVHEWPTVTIAGASYYCKDSSAILTASGAADYLWSTGAKTANLTVSAAGTYTVTGTDHNGCKNTAQAAVTESPRPMVQIVPADTTVCHGATVQPTIVNFIGTVTWSPASSVVINDSQGIIATATNECGSFNDTTRVMHTPLPADPVVSTPHSQSSASFCRGESEVLTAQSAGADVFEWYKDGQIIPGVAGATLSVTDAGAYHVKASTVNACYAIHPSNAIEVTVHEWPTITIAGASYYCKDSSAILTASGAASYLWSTGAKTANLTVGATGTYTVTGTDHNGCKNTAQATVTESPRPMVQIVPADTTVCYGATVQPVIVGNPIGTVTWSPASSVVINDSQDIIATATNECGGFNDTTRVVHMPLPAEPLISTPHSQSSASFCRGESEVLTVQSAGADVFEWYKDGQIIPGVAGATLSVTDAGAYHVKTSTVNACYAIRPSNAIEVTVHELPAAPELSNTDICKDDIPIAPNMSDKYTFLWYDEEYRPIGDPPLRSNAIGASTYHITQKDNSTGCEGPAAMWVYTVNDLPNVSIAGASYFCETRGTMLTASGAASYLWNTGATAASITVRAANTYSVTGSDRNGCENTAQATVEERPAPQVTANNDTMVCYGNEVTLGTQQHTGTLRWNSSLTVKVTGPQTYTVTARNECGMASDNMVVDVFAPTLTTVPDLPPYKYKEYYEQRLLFENADPPAYLQWVGSLPGGLTITPDGMLRGMPMITGHNFDSHRFTVFLEDQHDCKASQSFLLTPLFHAPNAIIRDGGENAQFLPDFDLEIFNRQGVVIHRGKGWRGTSGSSQVPPGTYFYKVEVVQDGVPRQYMGYIAVLE